MSAVTPDDFLAALLYQFTAMLQMEAALERLCAIVAVAGGLIVLLMLLREVRERREKRDGAWRAAAPYSEEGASLGGSTRKAGAARGLRSERNPSESETDGL